MKKLLILGVALLLGCGCSKREDPDTLKIAASPVPHAQMLNFIKPSMKQHGINLEVIVVDDYTIPDRALAEKEVMANFFQHIPFMEEQIHYFHYPIECYARIHLEPMAIYSDKIRSLDDLRVGDIVAVPNDPTNEYRALSILVDHGLITLRPGANLRATVADIETNRKKLKFRELDAALLPRTLKEVTVAAIPTNFALQAHLNPTKDALAIESEDSPYANIIAIRIEDEDDPRLRVLKREMLSDKMRAFILKEYRGAIIPVLKECPTEDATIKGSSSAVQ